MFTQEDIDAVLADAQGAVDALSDNVGNLAESQSPQGRQPEPVPTPQPPARAPAEQPHAVSSSDRIQRILKLQVPLVVRLAARRMSLGEVLKIMPGTILEFTRTVDEELDVMVNNHQIGSGVAVKVNESFGIRITYVGDIRQRIRSLAG
ncbi:MAG: FliM/FliN family flagellar motor switch protein [Planctomycetota bacterium]